MSAVKLNTYTKTVARVRELLAHWLETGLDLFLELRRIELDGIWKLPGHAGFQDFLSAEFPNTLGIERYNNVIQAIELHGEDFVRRVGVHSCHALVVRAVAENPEHAKLVRASVLHHVEQHGCAPEQAELRKIVRGVVGDFVRPAASTRAVGALARAQEELRRLRARLREVEAECESLRKAVAKTQSAKGGARKPARKVSKSRVSHETRRNA